jgi:uncharacterized protein (DUF1501 family)
MKRRSFIKRTGLATTGLFIPGFLRAFDQTNLFSNGKKLIVVQLSGGFDGLSAVVPKRNDIYYAARKITAISPSECLALNDDMGLNQVMSGIHQLYENGDLSIINQVGYPNANRSHFRSMDIWHSASNSDQHWPTGWLGRYLDQTENKNYTAHMAVEMDAALSFALKGEQHNGLAVHDINILHKTLQSGHIQSISSALPPQSENNTLDYLYKTLASTTSSIEYIKQQSKIYKSSLNYPAGIFGKRLKSISELICSGSETQIYYVSLTGFDTHANQKPTINRLLQQLSDGLKTLVEDLKENNAFNDCTILVFSEFGRRVHENGSGGTDHGAGNNVFLIGNQLKKPGFYNAATDLTQLDEGDVAYTIDFRKIYADILKNWLQTDDTKILTKTYNTLNLFKTI